MYYFLFKICFILRKKKQLSISAVTTLRNHYNTNEIDYQPLEIKLLNCIIKKFFVLYHMYIARIEANFMMDLAVNVICPSTADAQK